MHIRLCMSVLDAVEERMSTTAIEMMRRGAVSVPDERPFAEFGGRLLMPHDPLIAARRDGAPAEQVAVRPAELLRA